MFKDSLDHSIRKNNFLVNRKLLALAVDVKNQPIFRILKKENDDWIPIESIINDTTEWTVIRKDRITAAQYESLIENKIVPINHRIRQKVDHNLYSQLFDIREEIRLKDLKEEIKNHLKDGGLGPHGVGFFVEEIILHENFIDYSYVDVQDAIHRCVNIHDKMEFIRINKDYYRHEFRICSKDLEKKALDNISEYLKNPVDEWQYLESLPQCQKRIKKLKELYK
jgi:hypothetical protein